MALPSPLPSPLETKMNTRKQKKARLARIKIEHNKAIAEANRFPESGNGFATRAEMLKAISELYLSTICSLERQLAN